MSARSLNFSDPLPQDIIYSDSSFILNLISAIHSGRATFSTDCELFLQRIQTAMQTGLCLVTSDFAIDEVCYYILRDALSKSLPFNDSTAKRVYKSVEELYKHRPEIIQCFLPKLERFYQYLEAIPFFVLSYPDLTDLKEALYKQVKSLISSYNLYPADAYHIAIGRSAGANDFVALDKDWFRIDGINLYTCLPSP